jgi:hypothetical protein
MKKSIFIFLCLPLACTQNLLEDMTSQNPDEDFYQEALGALNNENYSETILIINTKMSSAWQVTPKVRELLASAYAGQCGLNFIDYTEKLSIQYSGSPLSNLMLPFVQVVVDPASCRTALETMELIGTTESRTDNQNIFTSVTGMVLMGTALRNFADISPVLGDGSTDINLCMDFTDAQIDDIIIGFGFFNKNFTAVTSGIIGSYSSFILNDIITMCGAVESSAACTTTNPADITPSLRATFRDIINTQEYGVGAFLTGGDPLTVPMSCI